MGPKRHQGPPQTFVDSGLSSEDEAQAQNEDQGPAPSPAKCPHVNKAVHIPGLKKQLKTSWAK